MQEFANVHSMRNEILSLMTEQKLENDCYLEMLDFTIDLFESQGLGTEYYGYHNINHELEVTYISLLAINQEKIQFTEEDKKHLYVAALFHDFDPQKSVDKPHEESVLKFISTDKRLRELLTSAKIDLEIILSTLSEVEKSLPSNLKYDGKTLFIKGEKSDYIDNSNSKVLINFFPNYKIAEVLNAGHWVHAENLNDFIKEIEFFLKS